MALYNFKKITVVPSAKVGPRSVPRDRRVLPFPFPSPPPGGLRAVLVAAVVEGAEVRPGAGLSVSGGGTLLRAGGVWAPAGPPPEGSGCLSLC